MITKRYSTYTLFTASVSKTVFVVLQIPHKNIIKLKTTEEETKNVVWRKRLRRLCVRTKGPFSVICEGKPLNLLTLTQGSTILSGNQSGRQLATQLGLCSCSGLPVRAGTASPCWVFVSTSIVLILILAFESLILQERIKFSLRVIQICVQN